MKIHIIPHTHWDREWYFTTSRSQIYLMQQIKEVLALLESNKEFKYYLLDGQTSLIEDYLSYFPEDTERIKKLVLAKRLFTGPWYTQTDQLVIHGESVIRNLLLGQRYASKLGHSMEIGYVPDAFGQAGNMPIIYQEFNIKNILFWRGVANNTNKAVEFIWEGEDGTKVNAYQIRYGYGIGLVLPESIENFDKWYQEALGQVIEETNFDSIYVANGFDQAPIRYNLPSILETYNRLNSKNEYLISNPELFFESLNYQAENLNTLKGELTQAKHSRIHKTIFSSRADLKMLNNQLEYRILNQLEPLSVMASQVGIEYPQAQIEKIWKLMFENAAHDSIGNCNSDETNQDIKHRYKQVTDQIDALEELLKREICQKIKYQEAYNITLFNTYEGVNDGVHEIKVYLPSLNPVLKNSQGQVIKYQILDYQDHTDYVFNQILKVDYDESFDIPQKAYLCTLKILIDPIDPFSYQTISVFPQEQYELKSSESSLQKIENEFYEISLNDHNSLIKIIDKQNNQIFEEQLKFVDNGDDGDSYNYSPPLDDLLIDNTQVKANHAKVLKTELSQILQYQFTLNVPLNLEARSLKLCDQELIINVEIELTNSPVIKYKVTVNNNVYSHRLVVQFASKIASKFALADQVGGLIKRPVELVEVNVWQQEKWTEKPICIEAMQSFVALESQKYTYTIFTKGVREYEIVGENFDTIQLTLFRTFSYMGKENLQYRPGRASGEKICYTPDAELIGLISFEFNSLITLGKFDEFDIAKLIKKEFTPILSYQNDRYLNGRMRFLRVAKETPNLNTQGQLLELEIPNNVVMSCLKKAEDNSKIVFRINNPYFEKEINLESMFKNKYEQVQLNELQKTNKNKLKYSSFATYIEK